MGKHKVDPDLLESARWGIIDDVAGSRLHLALPRAPASISRFLGVIRYVFYPVFWLLLRWRTQGTAQLPIDGRARSLRLHRDEGTLTLGLEARGLSPPLSWVLDLDRVRVVRVQAKRNSRGLALEFAFSDLERCLLALTASVADVDQGSEALDLAMRVAHIIGLRGYRVRPHEPSVELDVELVRTMGGDSAGPFRSGQTGGAPLRIPEVSQHANYEAGLAPAFAEPDEDVADVDPSSFDEVVIWNPNLSIMVRDTGLRTFASVMGALGQCAFLFVGLTYLFGVVLLILGVGALIVLDAFGLGIDPNTMVWACGAIGMLFTTIFIADTVVRRQISWWAREPQQVTFDWSEHMLTLTTPRARRQWGMGEIQGVRARRVSSRGTVVQVLLPGFDIQMLAVPDHSSAEAMTLSLARVLDVPWHIEDDT